MYRHRSIIMMLILTIITFGIYSLYWVYAVRDEMNTYLNDNSKSPLLNMILTFLCGIYFIYIAYDYSNDVTKMQQKAGLPTNNMAIANLLLAIFGFGIVSIFIIQAQLNEVYAKDQIA